MRQIGYSWYYKWHYDDFDADSTIYATLEEAQMAMKKYQKNHKSIPLSAYGIDKLDNDEGYVQILERVIIPTTAYWGWGDEEDEEDDRGERNE